MNLKANNKYNLYKIFLFAMIIRFITYYYFPTNLFPDSVTYINFSKNLFTEESILSYNKGMPGYPIILATSNFFFSNYNFIDIFFSSILVFVLAKTYKKIFDDDFGSNICALIWAIYPFSIFYSISILTENSYVFFFFTGVFFLYYNKYYLGFFFIILSILIRPTLDLLNILIISTIFYFVHKENFISILKKILIFILMYILILSFWWLHNYKKYGEFVRLNLGFGTVLFAGNNSLNNTGGGNINKDFIFPKFNHKNEILIDKRLKIEAIKYIKNNPSIFLKNSYKKFKRMFNIFPNYQEKNLVNKVSHDFINWLSAITILILYTLSTISLLFFLKKETFLKLIPMLIYFFLITSIHLITIGSIRYRFPIEIILLMLSSYCLQIFYYKIHKYLKK